MERVPISLTVEQIMNSCMLKFIHKLTGQNSLKTVLKGRKFEKSLKETKINFRIITGTQKCYKHVPETGTGPHALEAEGLSSNTE